MPRLSVFQLQTGIPFNLETMTSILSDVVGGDSTEEAFLQALKAHGLHEPLRLLEAFESISKRMYGRKSDIWHMYFPYIS